MVIECMMFNHCSIKILLHNMFLHNDFYWILWIISFIVCPTVTPVVHLNSIVTIYTKTQWLCGMASGSSDFRHVFAVGFVAAILYGHLIAASWAPCVPHLASIGDTFTFGCLGPPCWPQEMILIYLYIAFPGPPGCQRVPSWGHFGCQLCLVGPWCCLG